MISNDPKLPTAVTSALVLAKRNQEVRNPEFAHVDNTLVVGHASASFTSGKKDWITITDQKVSAILPGIGQATAALIGKVSVTALGAGSVWIGGTLVYHATKDGKTHAFDIADYDVHVTVAGAATDGTGTEAGATETPAVTETPAAAPASSQKKPRGKQAGAAQAPAAQAPAADVTAPAAPTAPAAVTTPAPRQGRGRTAAAAPAAPAPTLEVVAAPAAGATPAPAAGPTRAPRQPRPVASIPA